MAKLTLRSNEDIRLAIRRRAHEIAAAMKDSELFLSTQFRSYATRLADFILRKHRLYSLNIIFDDSPDSLTACTDGKDITINAGNELAQQPKLLERRFKVVMGLLFHEAAHKLFLDFSFFRKALKSIESGTLFGNFPTNGNADLDKAKLELESVTASSYAGAIAQLYAQISNIVDDGHDEASMKRCFPGFITECIVTMDDVQLELTPTVEDLIARRESDFGIISLLLLEYVLWGTYKYDSKTPDVEKYLDIVAQLEPTLDVIQVTDEYKQRWNYLNLLILQLWPYVRDMFPENAKSSQPSGSGSGQQGAGGSHNGQNPQGSSAGTQPGTPQSGQQGGQQGQAGQTPTPDEVKQALQALAQVVQQAANVNPAPVNGSGKPVTAAALQAGQMQPGNSGDLSNLLMAVATDPATKQIQKELDDAQMEAIRNQNVPLIHADVPIRTKRHLMPKEREYKKILHEISPVLRNLVKEMKALLRELNEDFLQRHRRFGPIIEATESYRPDRAFFAKKKLPEDLPNMALCVLIDQSGSMSGSKIEYARRTAILLEQFASQLQIPVMIAGHSTSGDDVIFNIYTDFLSAMSEKDRYALAGIETIGANRDGLPIRKCCGLLDKRQEQVRMLIVISDGAPAHWGYRGEEAMQDITDTVKEYRRKGLLIYGAAIDKDKNVIEKIYGKNFISIEDINKMPKTLVRLVRQQIV